mgnify:CR=1 FL=1
MELTLAEQVAEAIKRGSSVNRFEGLRELRDKAGLTQAAMAALLQVSRPTYLAWDAGKRNISAKHLARFLDVTSEIQSQTKDR